MKSPKPGIILLWCLLTVSGLSISGLPPAHGQPTGEDFSAVAEMPVVAGRTMVGPGADANINISIDSYSSDEEARSMGEKFASGGHKSLRNALGKATVKGQMTFRGRTDTYQFKLLRSTPTQDGRRIYAIGERSIRFLDAYYPGTSKDEEFGTLQLDLKKVDGVEQGSGTLMHRAKIKSLDANNLVLGDNGIEPARLRWVKKQ